MNWKRLEYLLKENRAVPLYTLQKPSIKDGDLRNMGIVLVGSKMVDDFCKMIEDEREHWFVVSISQSPDLGESINADLHVYPNDKLNEDYLLSPPGKKKIPFLNTCCGCFVSPELFYKEDIEKEYDLLLITKTLPFKRAKLFVKTLKENPDLTGTLVTFGIISRKNRSKSQKYTKSLRKLIEEYKLPNLNYLNVDSTEHKNKDGSYVVGELSKDEIRKLINQSRIYLLTSRAEGFNRSFSEALCSDVPVLVMEDLEGGMLSRFRKGMGEISKPDPKVIGNKVREMLENSKSYEPRDAYLNEMGTDRENEVLLAKIDEISKENHYSLNIDTARKYYGDLWTKEIYEIVDDVRRFL
jgi:hypothetical protein